LRQEIRGFVSDFLKQSQDKPAQAASVAGK
jgi:hypothetical protein